MNRTARTFLTHATFFLLATAVMVLLFVNPAAFLILVCTVLIVAVALIAYAEISLRRTVVYNYSTRKR